MRSYFDLLRQYGNSDILPMHMPGHKRKNGYMGGIAKFDVTETTALDDLHHPTGIIKEAMEETAALCGSDESFILVNGSSCGILSAITAVCDHHDTILLPRNCHKSALNAVTILGLRPLWVEPPKISPLHIDGSISPKNVKNMLEHHPETKAVFIVSPTYEGVVSDIRAIADIVHKHHAVLIVDAAHGGHFRFCEAFPADALSEGADIVVESLHKTLPALTQTAMLHVKSDSADKDRLRFALQCYQSSSPSHLLIASAVECLRLMEQQGTVLFPPYLKALAEVRATIEGLAETCLFKNNEHIFGYDTSKLVFGFNGYSGGDLRQKLLHDFHIEIEMSTAAYVLALTSVYDNAEDLFRFASSVTHLRRELPLRKKASFPEIKLEKRKQMMLPTDAFKAKKEMLPLKESKGYVSAETLYLYPPGSPLLVAGELIDEKIIEAIRRYDEYGYTIHGTKKGYIPVVK